MDTSLTTIDRQTYGLLDWIGDVGGLFDGLKLVGAFLVAPFASFAMQAEVLTAAFRTHQIEGLSSNKTSKVEKLTYMRASLCG